MTVTASPNDLPPGSATNTAPGSLGAVGKGQTLLNGIAATQTALNASVPNSVNNRQLAYNLNQLQIQAVDYFMATYWVAADQIIAQMYPAMAILPKNTPKFVTSQLAAIAARAAQLVAIGTSTPTGTPPGGTVAQGNNYPQYSRAYPLPSSGYPLTQPDVYWYQLNTQFVDYLMNKAHLPASLILSFMTGVQTYASNAYWSNYTFYQQYWDGQY